MFSNTKSSFGTPSNTFGFSSNVTRSPFAQTTFGKPATTGFGTPFGAGTSSTFGQPVQTRPGFGGGIFGAQNAQSGNFGPGNSSLFAQQNKPLGFGFPSTSSSGFFGQSSVQPHQSVASVFGQNTTNLFGNASGFGVASTQAGTPTKFTPVSSADTIFRAGLNQTVNTRHQCITFMNEYENKSLEELRWEDYQLNRKHGNQLVAGLFSNIVQPTQNIFGSSVVATSGSSVFGQTDNKSVFGVNAQPNFGQTNPVFGAVSSVGSSAPFGKVSSGFGIPNNASSFTFNTNPQQGSLFGKNTPTTLFSKASQPSNIFGQPTSGFGTQSNLGTFGTGTNQNIFAGLGLPSSQNTSLFSGTKTTGLYGFNNTPTQPNQNLFNKPVSSFLGQTSTANVGTNASIFGNTSNKFPNTLNNNLGVFNSGFGINNMNTTFGLNNMNMQCVNNSNQNQLNSEEKILYMSATPYGIPKLLNNVPEVNSDLKDVVRFRNNAELKTLLNTVNKNSSEASLDKLQPVHILRRAFPEFDGLEEKDYSVVSNFRVSNNPKRLMLRLRNSDDRNLRFGTDFESVSDVSKNIENDFPLGYSAASICSSDCDRNINSIILTGHEQLNCDLSVPKDKSKELSLNDNEIEQELFLEARDTLELEENTSEALENDDDTPISTETICEPHPTGIVLTRSEYYTIPSPEDLLKFISPDGTCVVKGFTVGRTGYGNVYFPDSFDVSNLNLDEILHIRHKEINIYPDDSKKPPLGQGLNRRAQVTLDNVWPYDKNLKKLITDVDILNKMEYSSRLRRLCEKQNTRFVEYRPETGSWVFKVEHFSKYSHQDSDDSEDEIVPNIPDNSSKKLVTESVTPVEHLPEGPNNIDTPSKKRQINSETNYEPFLNNHLCDSMELIKVPKMSQNTPEYNNNHLEMMKQTFFDKNNVNGTININNSSVDCEILKLTTLDQNFRPESPESPNILMEYDDYDTILNHFDDEDDDDEKTSFFDISSDDIEINIHGSVLPYHVTGFNESDLADAIMFKGRSFKVGWGKGLMFTHLTTRQNIDVCRKTLGTILQSRSKTDYSSALVQVISLRDLSNSSKRIFEDDIESLLTNQFLASEYNIEDGVPHFKSSFGFDLLVNHQNSMRNKPKTDYLRQIWNLCYALWGKLEETNLETHLRRKYLSDWLQNVVSEEVENNLENYEEITYNVILENILTYVSGNNLEEAALIAFKSNDFHLSMLISLLPTNLETKAFIYKQLEDWRTSNSLNHINKTLVKLYMLLAGESHLTFDNQLLHVYENLDWMRTLGIFLWFLTDPAHPLKDAVQMYEETFLKGICAKPISHYLRQTKNIYDLRYELLKFYSDANYTVDKILNPITYTDDPLNYALTWLILQMLSSLGYESISNEIRIHIHMNFAAQLERLGFWHWSVFVLLFIDDFHIRKQSIKNIIERNIQIFDGVTPEYLKKEKILLQKFQIPLEWIDFAKCSKMFQHGNV